VTHETTRYFWIVFYGVGIVAMIMLLLSKKPHGLWLKAVSAGFILGAMLRSLYDFTQMGNKGIAVAIGFTRVGRRG
jgi:hypothetical protein